MSQHDMEDADVPPPAADEPSVEHANVRDDAEKRIRRDVARLRDQLRAAQAEHESALSQLRFESRDRLMRAELRSEAMRAGIVDLDGLRLADTTGVVFTDDGSVEGVDAVIARLKETKPYLFHSGKDTASFGATTSPVVRAPAPAAPEWIDARSLTREQWQAERARLLSRRT